FDFDVVSQSYTDLNELQTNYTTSNKYTISPKAGLTYEKDKFRFTLSSTTSIVDFDNHSLYLNNTTDLNQHYILPYAKAQIRYKLEKSKILNFRYNYSNNLPTSTQLMPVANLANPLNTIIGNPNLRPNEKNSVNVNYRNFDMRTRSGYN